MTGQTKDAETSNENLVSPSAEEGGTFGVNHDNGNSIPPSDAHARGRNMEDIIVPLNDVPAFTPSKKLKVAIVGAGCSGLIMAHKLMYQHAKETEKILDFTIFEAKDVAGGTWVDNTYPGGMLAQYMSFIEEADFDSDVRCTQLSLCIFDRRRGRPALAITGVSVRPKSKLVSFLLLKRGRNHRIHA